MSTYRENVLASIRRARDFINLRAPALSLVNQSRAREDLEAAAADINRDGSNYLSAITALKGVRGTIKDLRYQIVTTCLRPIAAAVRSARSKDLGIACITVPAEDAALETLIYESSTLADALARFQYAFSIAGLPLVVGARLRQLARELQDESLKQAAYLRWRLKAKAALLDDARRGRAAVGMLDALVRIQFSDQPALLSYWKIIKTIRPSASAPLVLRRRG